MNAAIHYLGNQAILVALDNADEVISRDLHNQVQHAVSAIQRADLPGVVELVPAYDSVLIHLAEDVDLAYLRRLVEETLTEAGGDGVGPTGDGEPAVIPVCYGNDFGPDFMRWIEHIGLPEAEAIRRHTRREYFVHMLGFSPGFAFLGGMDDALAKARQATPRVRVPPGAVGIANGQTGIYPVASPGGWNLIGRTPVKLFDPARTEPFLLKAGQRVRFEAIGIDEFNELADQAAESATSAKTNLSGRGEDSHRSSAVGETLSRCQVLRVIDPGLQTTVQDAGRPGYRAFGVPQGGALDRAALEWANRLLGNEPHAAALEMTLQGPTIEALCDLRLACFGGGFRLRVNGRLVLSNRFIEVQAGDVIECGHAGEEMRQAGQRAGFGCRGYLAVRGGIEVPVVMGSRSTCLAGAFGGFKGRALQAGDVLSQAEGEGADREEDAMAKPAAIPYSVLSERRNWLGSDGVMRLHVLPGPELHRLTSAGRVAFERITFRVGPSSNRMGCRLECDDGPRSKAIEVTRADIISSGVVEGTVQIPASGQPLLLLGDCQTVGGFARVACLPRTELGKAAQLKPGDPVQFCVVQ